MKGKSIYGVMAIAMLLIVGLIAPATAQMNEGDIPEEDCTNWIETTYKEVFHTWTGGASEGPTDDSSDPSWNETSGDPDGLPHDQEYGVPYRTDSAAEGTPTGSWFLWTEVVDEEGYCDDESDPELQLTSICAATEAGTYLVYVNSTVGFEEMALNAGEHAFRVVNTGTVETTYSYDGNVMATLAPGEWDFFAVPTAQPGTTIITYGNGLQETKAQNTDLCDLADEDDEVIITLQKEWFDAEGDLLTEAPNVDWEVELYTGEGEVQATLPGDAEALLVSGTRYGVQENIQSEDWEVVSCDSVNLSDTDITYDQQGLGDTNLNAFTADDDGVHLVCNQAVDDDDDDGDDGEDGETIIIEPEPEIIEREVIVERTTPTRIDSGTGGLLPTNNEGTNYGVLALLLGGLAMAGTGTAAVARRRK